MSAAIGSRRDYPAMVAWLKGPLTGINADLMEDEVGRALREIDDLRAKLIHYIGWFGRECPCDDYDGCPL